MCFKGLAMARNPSDRHFLMCLFSKLQQAASPRNVCGRFTTTVLSDDMGDVPHLLPAAWGFLDAIGPARHGIRTNGVPRLDRIAFPG